MNLIEAAKQLIAATDKAFAINEDWLTQYSKAVADLIEAIAEAEKQEPVAYLKFWAYQQVSPDGSVNADDGLEVCRPGEIGMDGKQAISVYTLPQQPKEWVGLTKTVTGNYLRRHPLGDQSTFRQGFKEGVAFASAALKAKNGGQA